MMMTATSDNKQQRQALGRMVSALNVMRMHHPTIESQTVQVFLEIARADSREDAEGVYMQDLAEMVGLAQSSTSRSIALLSKYLKRGTAGLELIDVKEDPMNRRKKLLTLTRKGRMVADEIAKAIDGG